MIPRRASQVDQSGFETSKGLLVQRLIPMRQMSRDNMDTPRASVNTNSWKRLARVVVLDVAKQSRVHQDCTASPLSDALKQKMGANLANGILTGIPRTDLLKANDMPRRNFKSV